MADLSPGASADFNAVLLLVGVVSFISAARNTSHLALLLTSANRLLAMLQLDYMVEERYETEKVLQALRSRRT